MPRGSLNEDSLKLAIPNSLPGLKEGQDALGKWLTASSVGQEVENRAFLVYDEIVTNIIRYAFDDGREHRIGVDALLVDSELALTFEDDGRAFDPRRAPRPEPQTSLAKAQIGGRGLILVRKAAKRIDYERTQNGHNRLTVALALR